MKKNICLFVFLVSSVCVFAQRDIEYKKFRVDIGSGVHVFSNALSPSVLVEPRFSLSPTFAIGLRGEFGIIFRYHTDQESNFSLNSMSRKGYINGVSGGSMINLMGTIDAYLVKDRAFRPYVGVGLGATFQDITFTNNSKITDTKKGTASSYDYTLNGSAGNKQLFLIGPRIGFDVWHFRFNLSYYIGIGADNRFASVDYKETTNSSVIGKLSDLSLNGLSYDNFTAQILFYFGGGSKR